MKKSLSNPKMLAEAGIMLALSVALSFIKLYRAPQGGSVTLASMFPLIVFAIRWGVKNGLIVGAVYGVLSFIVNPYFFHPIQVVLDYPLAFLPLGICGYTFMKNDRKNILGYIPSVALGHLLRAVSHIISGVVFFAEYAGDMNPVKYSMIYNFSYIIPEFFISIVFLFILWKPINSIIEKQY